MENDNTITVRQTLFPNPQLGRCICFYTVSLSEKIPTVKFYSIPFDCFGANPYVVEGLVPFYMITDQLSVSPLSSVGSSLLVVGLREDLMENLMPLGPLEKAHKIYQLDTTEPAHGWRAISMPIPRISPTSIVMDGKLYVIGGSIPYAPPFTEMFDDPCLISSSTTSVPLPPIPLSPTKNKINWFPLVIAALQKSKKILVATTDVAFLYNVVDQVWAELDHKVDFSCVEGQAAVVGNSTLLCWCSRNGEEVHAYDLVRRRWFISPINGLDRFVHMYQPDESSFGCPLFPLDDNHLCFLWENPAGFDGTVLPQVHCTKIRVSIYADAQGEIIFDADVVASRSYALLGPGEAILHAHVFLGEEGEGGERGSHVHGRRTSERCGYGDGGTTTESIAPFKTCLKCWYQGHTERDCKGIPCLLCRGIGHLARHCPNKPYFAGDGLNVGGSGSWVVQPSIH